MLLEHGAMVEVASPTICLDLSRLAEVKIISVLNKEYEPGDLKGNQASKQQWLLALQPISALLSHVKPFQRLRLAPPLLSP